MLWIREGFGVVHKELHREGQPTQEWLKSIGVSLPGYMGPWQQHPRIRILLLTNNSVEDTFRTIASLLASTVQDYKVAVDYDPGRCDSELHAWLSGDVRFSVGQAKDFNPGGSEITMVLPAGIVLTPFTIEALLQTTAHSDAQVVRVAVSKCAQGIEFWKTEFLVQHAASAAEDVARKSGGERWVNGEALGVHNANENPPKVFFRRGGADRHVVDVVVYQARSEMPARQPIEEIAALQRELARLRKVRKRLKPGAAQQAGVALFTAKLSISRRFRRKR